MMEFGIIVLMIYKKMLFHLFMTLAYNYEILALQRCNETSPYTIHGLWPTWNATTWPQFCDNSTIFDESKLEIGVIKAMNINWFSCPGFGTNFDFWSHEWSKHGTCSGLTQNEYFSRGLSYYLNGTLWAGKCPEEDSTQECLVAIFQD